MAENAKHLNLKRIALALAEKYETEVASAGTDLHKIALILEEAAEIEPGADSSDATSLRRIAVALETMNGDVVEEPLVEEPKEETPGEP